MRIGAAVRPGTPTRFRCAAISNSPPTPREHPQPSHLPELRVAGCRGRPADLRRAARRRPRCLVRPERAARRRRLGCVDPPADQGVRAVRADHLGEHAGARGGLLPARMEPRGEPHAGHGGRQGVPVAGGDRRHRRRQRPRAGEVPRGAVDAPARRAPRRRRLPRACSGCSRAAVPRRRDRRRLPSHPLHPRRRPPRLPPRPRRAPPRPLPPPIRRRSRCCRSST